MGAFKSGTYTNKCNDAKRRYIRVSSGPQRGRYVHDLILEFKLQRRLSENETAEHIDGNGLNNSFDNITGPVTRAINTRQARARNNGK